MTNFENHKRLDIDELAATFDDIRRFGCYYCFYHYERERNGQDRECPNGTSCIEGYRKWLESEVTDE